jgi:ATP-dependent exoDNAse (exonuclease V) beta subunit
VVDYKSHQQADSETTAALASSYRQQLDYYAIGVKRLWPERRVRRFLLFTHPQLLHEIESTEPLVVGA